MKIIDLSQLEQVESIERGDNANKDILLVGGLYLQNAPENFLFFCLPWKLKKINGAPCQAIALII